VDEPKRFVYVLRNLEKQPRYYVGLTANVAGRLTWHNSGRCHIQRGTGPGVYTFRLNSVIRNTPPASSATWSQAPAARSPSVIST